jgi:hypothetical protein
MAVSCAEIESLKRWINTQSGWTEISAFAKTALTVAQMCEEVTEPPKLAELEQHAENYPIRVKHGTKGMLAEWPKQRARKIIERATRGLPPHLLGAGRRQAVAAVFEQMRDLSLREFMRQGRLEQQWSRRVAAAPANSRRPSEIHETT